MPSSVKAAWKRSNLADLPTSDPGNGKPWLDSGLFRSGAGLPVVATPTASPAAGSYASTQLVTLSCATSGASIYYTTDGSQPTTSSTLYTGVISVATTKTLKAIAAKSGSTSSATLTAAYTITGATLPGTITDAWRAGLLMYQDSGMTQPVDTAGQSIVKWVGEVNRTVLTLTNCIAKLIDGILVPVFVDSGSATLPTGSYDRRNLGVWIHQAVPGLLATRGHFAFGTGTTRELEVVQFDSIKPLHYNGAAVTYLDNLPLCSPATLHYRASATNQKVGINSSSQTLSVLSAGTMTHGVFGKTVDGNLAGMMGRIWAIVIGPNVSDSDSTQVIDWAGSIRARVSDTAPTKNIVVCCDSISAGTNSNGESWQYQMTDTDGYRVISAGGAAQYFGVGSIPINGTANTTAIDAHKLAGAGENVIIIFNTNDLSSTTGSTHFSNVKTWGQARQAAGWKVAVCTLYNRLGVDYASWRTEAATFNGLIASDPWMDYVCDVKSAIDNSGTIPDGIHVSEAGQPLIYDAIKAGIT